MTLPAWTYHHEEFLALEKEALFLRSWQLVGHVSEVENPGDYLRFDLLGESAIVVRDARGGLRAFHNVCRHRASRLLKQRAGHCGTLITCPYHGFSYDLGGRLVAVVGVEDFDELDKSQHALVPLELEVHLGLIFVRFLADEGPSVARQLAPFEALLKGYLIADMRPLAPLTTQVLHANWKVAVENTLEAYHVATAHPRLKQLLAGHETLELRPFGASRGGDLLAAELAGSWSERHYQRLLPDVPHLPLARKRAWQVCSLFPNLALELYPDQLSVRQVLPVAAGVSVSRAASYALPDSHREMRAVRYLNARIRRRAAREDRELIEGAHAGIASSGYRPGPLSRREARVRQFQMLIREKIPPASRAEPPAAAPPGRLAAPMSASAHAGAHADLATL